MICTRVYSSAGKKRPPLAWRPRDRISVRTRYLRVTLNRVLIFINGQTVDRTYLLPETPLYSKGEPWRVHANVLTETDVKTIPPPYKREKITRLCRVLLGASTVFAR